MVKRFFLALLLMLCVIVSFSQISSFSNEPEKFFKEMKSFLENANKDKGKAVMDEFKEFWEEETYPEVRRKKIYTTCNRMIKKRCRAYPHFYDYMRVLVIYSKYTPDENNFLQWEKGLNHLLKEKKSKLTTISSYINVGAGLFESNTIFSTATTQWKSNNADYKIHFNGEKTQIIFEKLDLTCISKRDSIKIFETGGIFDPQINSWKGVNGKVTWFKAELPENEVYAFLSRYEIDMKKSEYVADSAVFINTNYFSEPIMGVLKDKVVVVHKGENRDDKNNKAIRAPYPEFESYAKRFQIDDVFEYIDYDGGFKMKGSRFMGSGDEKQDAFLHIYRNDTLFLKIAAKTYVFYKDRVVSDRAKATFYLREDSIYHPGLTFKYNIQNKEVTLFRSKDDISRSVFYNSYHGLEMDVRQMLWKIDEPMIKLEDIKSTADLNYATFESIDFYRQSRYFEIQGMDDQNPLVVIRNYTKKYETREFTTKEFADFLRASIPAARHYLMALSYRGFISFDVDNDYVVVKPKLYNYIASSIGKRDYDVISFKSSTSGFENAQLSLLTYNLKISGVPEIFLSDSQNVAIFPDNQEILLKKNRDFEFNGKIRAGYFLFKGSNFKFDYDKFKIDLADVEYVKMRILSDWEVDKNGMAKAVWVQNKLENITGDLLIDAPTNKSGNNPQEEYPIFNSVKDAYVYYDGKKIQKGVYGRDKFYFQIYPFSMDSLDNMKNKQLQFPGYFVSGGVFPPFEDTLRLMADYSLGFIRKAPEGGVPLYGGKGSFENDIILSNQGLRGDGEMKYGNSTVTSNDFVFYPDSMNTIAQEFKVKEQKTGVQYPSVYGEKVKIHWEPHNDELLASDMDKPLKMYNDQATLHGTAKVTPAGLSGWGRLEFESAQLFSDMYTFNHTTVDADTADFNLKDINMEDFSFKTNNVNAHLDFENRLGEFQSNGEASFVEFPQNQYICYMDRFTWFMDKEEIEMSASKKALDKLPSDTASLSPTELEDIQLQGSEFISIHPNQDSLSFVAPSAKYSLRNKIITANEVKFIRVADATVYPGDGKVVIEKKAKMQTLADAKIIANTTTRFHNIYNATTNIYGKKDYTANGDYDYIDETGAKQTFHFDVISVDTSTQTYATGKIGVTDGFTLSPDFEYSGKVKMEASKEYLVFDGSVRMKHECEAVKPAWIQFESEIDPNEIFIPIGKAPQDINNNMVHASFMMTNDSAHIYPAFLNKHKTYSDTEMIPASGFLHYDKQSGKYKIADKEKLIEFNLPGNYLSIHRSACNMYGEGKVDLGVNFGQIAYQTVGSINHDMINDDFSIDLIMTLSFFFQDKCLEIMAEAINTAAAEPVDFERPIYNKGLVELVGKESADEFIANLALGTFKKFPKELEQSLVISHLEFKFDPRTHTFTSDGPIGISNIFKTQIHKYVDGHVEITKKRSGDILTIYLELDESNWFFFIYRNGVMRTVSSNEMFNNLIKEMKPDDRRMKVEKGQAQYTFYPATLNVMKKFRKKFEVQEEEQDDGTGEESNDFDDDF